MAAKLDLLPLRDVLEPVGLWPLPKQADEQLRRLYDLVLAGNEKVNLTRIVEPRDFVLKHLADSLLVLPVLAEWQANSDHPEARPVFSPGDTVADIGCGAGFPGLPLAIILPEVRFVEIDGNGKKVAFVQEAAAELGLENAECLRAHTTELTRQGLYQGHFQSIVARAVGDTKKLVAGTRDFLDRGGRLICYKTPRAAHDERHRIFRAARRAGLRAWLSPDVDLPGEAGKRCFWIFSCLAADGPKPQPVLPL